MNKESTNQDVNTGKFLRNVLIKGVLFFLILNFVVGLIPADWKAGQLSLYNLILPGRVRLPFGENPKEAYNLSLYNLDAMFASHEINAGAKPEDEFRVIVIGDSAAWGTLLYPEDTLTGLINLDKLTTSGGKMVRAYNLAYPTMSLTKDLMILEKALIYTPDMIIWPVTLESFPRQVQIETPLVANNPQVVQPLIEELDLPLDQESAALSFDTFWNRTLFGRRRAIFDGLQLQLYGVMWAATGVDQTYPQNVTPAQRDFKEGDDDFHGWTSGSMPMEQLVFEILDAGADLAGDIPILVVNEPILISEGENSDIRYNFFYPQWAYDQYREAMAVLSQSSEWEYVDLWDIIPQEEFTNSAVHLTPKGSRLYYQAMKPALYSLIGE